LNDATSAKKTRSTKRDPERTRAAILEVAGRLLAKDGPEGLSVSQVALRAGVNRGTAYHHFPTREDLLSATKTWVSEKLCLKVFGQLPGAGPIEPPEQMHNPRAVIDKLASFAMENPEFGRVWLHEVLSSSQPATDPFWNMYKSRIDAFVESEFAQPGINAEVHAVVLLVGVFLWPVWARAHSQGSKGRKKMARLFTDEMLRLSLHGTLREDKYPDIELPGLSASKKSKSRTAK
jgi:AcrR family transcriptional regulator